MLSLLGFREGAELKVLFLTQQQTCVRCSGGYRWVMPAGVFRDQQGGMD